MISGSINLCGKIYILDPVRTNRSGFCQYPSKGEETWQTSGVSSRPPPRVLTAILSVINSPSFRMTSRRPIGWAPERSSARGNVETEAICRSNLSSTTDRDVERLMDSDRVYRARREAREGDEGKVASSGGRPRRMRLPRTCVALFDSG